MTEIEKCQVLQTERTWISPIISLSTKVAQYWAFFLPTTEDGLIIGPSCMDICLLHVLYSVIEQLWLEIEVDRYAHTPVEEGIRKLCHYIDFF